MNTGISLNVGLNTTTSTIFSAPPLQGCESDAKAMFNIAKIRGFDMQRSKLLLGKDATHEAVKNAVTEAAQILGSGDLFFFSFAGHGTFQVVVPGAGDDDGHDESIVLTDHFMIDDFWRKELWPLFKPGVRVIAIADCCHSETSFFAPQNVPFDAESETGAADRPDVVSSASVSPGINGPGQRFRPRLPRLGPRFRVERSRVLPKAQEIKEFKDSKEFYDQNAPGAPKPVHANRLFLSACKDDEKAADGPQHGAFTKALLEVWANGNFAGNYNQLMAKVGLKFIGTDQTPQLTRIGNPDMSLEWPFSIALNAAAQNG